MWCRNRAGMPRSGRQRPAGADVAGVQGRNIVPLPDGRRPTDWERNVAGLAAARWATADMAYRRDALAAVGGFDERFRRAYREDADIALRVRAAGWRLARGIRRTHHPVGPAGRWVSVRLQAGNADDIMMRALHGGAGAAADVPRGMRRSHLTGRGGAWRRGPRRRRRPRARRWPGGQEGCHARLRWRASSRATRPSGGRDMCNQHRLPFAATWHTLPRHACGAALAIAPPRRDRERYAPQAVLFDRDGTLVVDVPYTPPRRVRLMPGAVRPGRLRAPASHGRR